MAEEGKQTSSTSGAPFLDGDRLLYAGRDCYLIPEELYSYGGKVVALDLSFNCIRDVEGLQYFAPTLQELVMDNNEILHTTEFPRLPKLTVLSLCNNKIGDLYCFLDMLEGKVPMLRFISLIGNKACPDSLTSSDHDDKDYSNYRSCLPSVTDYLLYAQRRLTLVSIHSASYGWKYLVYKFPTLKFIDSKVVTKAERQDAKRQGPYLKVVRPDTSQANSVEESLPHEYHPLPNEPGKSSSSAGHGVYRKTRYIYHGKHSEGNRFIRNDDL